MSQLALAAEAEVSARHLCFLETGRAQPSRDMVHLLASALDVPLTDRNAMLLAAGYAPAYAERGLDAPELQHVRRVFDFILERQEPFPAIVVDGDPNRSVSGWARRGALPFRVVDERQAPRVLRDDRPAHVVIERPYVGKSVRDAMTLNAGRAVCMLAAAAAKARVFDYTPAQVKKEIAGTTAEFWVKMNPVYYPELAKRHIAGIKRIER